MTKTIKPPPPALLLAVVERSLEPYKGVFPAATIEWMREEALLQLAAHPYPAALLRCLDTPQAVTESDVKAIDGGEPAAPSRPVSSRRGAA